MRPLLVDLLVCPGCGRFPLDLTTIERRPSSSFSDDAIDVERGYLACTSCERLYFVIDGIPRLLTEEFAELIRLETRAQTPSSPSGRCTTSPSPTSHWSTCWHSHGQAASSRCTKS